ncbi:MAG: hypothetical protein ACUVTG_04525 [Candidatus Oleimicrobiaceae bacterium]
MRTCLPHLSLLAALLFPLAVLLFVACEKIKGGGGGVVAPTKDEPYIIECVTCVAVDEQSKPVLVTSTFVVDEVVYVWIRWGNWYKTHTVSVKWFDPEGQLQGHRAEELTSDSGHAVTWFFIDTGAGAPTGDWWVEIYLDGEFMRSQVFTLISA